MDVTSEPGADGPLEFFEQTSIWRTIAVVFGGSLWAQLFWYPLATEFLSKSAGGLYVAVYLLPILVLFVSVVARDSAGFLFFFPSSLVPGLVVLPQQDLGALLEPYRIGFVAGTFLCFLLAGALAGRTDDVELSEREELEEGMSRRVEGVYRNYFVLRLAILLALFGVLVGAVIFDTAVVAAIAEHHGEGRVSAQIFLIVFGFFNWCVLAYTMFFLPAANIEYDARKLRRNMHAMVSGQKRIRRRLAITLVLGAIAAGGLLFYGYG